MPPSWPARAQNVAVKVRPRFNSMVVCNLARENLCDMKAPPPLAQLTVPRGTDLVKSRTSPRRFCRPAVAKKRWRESVFRSFVVGARRANRVGDQRQVASRSRVIC
jgi:hypothetical protein